MSEFTERLKNLPFFHIEKVISCDTYVIIELKSGNKLKATPPDAIHLKELIDEMKKNGVLVEMSDKAHLSD